MHETTDEALFDANFPVPPMEDERMQIGSGWGFVGWVVVGLAVFGAFLFTAAYGSFRCA